MLTDGLDSVLAGCLIAALAVGTAAAAVSD